MKIFIVLLGTFIGTCYHVSFSQTPIPLSKIAGTYEFKNQGMTVQFKSAGKKLFLITKGNPVQEMSATGINEYQSKTLKDGSFSFAENKYGKLFVTSKPQLVEGEKISDVVVDYTSAMDSVLTFKKSSPHFVFFFSKTDKNSIDSLEFYLENKYKKILDDFKLKNMPVVRVKIYPDLKSFHYAINFPDATSNIVATAFGADEVRMASVSSWDSTSGASMEFIPHEFTHCVHLNLDYSPNNPRWLWEGVAMYESGMFMNPADIDAIKNKEFPKLMNLNNGMEYMLGYVVIEAIKELWGFDAALRLIKSHGDSQSALNMPEEDFEKAIYTHIYSKYIKG